MLEAFVSVGAIKFDLTWTTCAGEKDGFRRAMPSAELARTLPALLDAAVSRQRNLIVRPHGAGITFIQLDDLSPDGLVRLAAAVFLTLETSPGNFQAWVAMEGPEDKDFARRLRKGAGADPTASGATRVAGSLNFKDKYAPDFPRVAVNSVHPGRRPDAVLLEQLGLVAPIETPARPLPPPSRSYARPGNRRWPDYGRCVKGAPLNRDHSGPDISRADFVWCMTAISWGWSSEDTAARLLEESAKARENGEGYAVLTAQNAKAAVERGWQSKKLAPETPDRG